MNLWDVGDSNPLTARPIHRFVKAEWFYRPLMLTSQFVAPTGLEPVTPGLKDRCARYRSPFAPRGRSIFLAPTPLKGRHYCLQYRFIVFISLFSNLYKYTNLSLHFKILRSRADSNHRRWALQAHALPTELRLHTISSLEGCFLSLHIRSVIHSLTISYILIPLIKILVILFQYIVPKFVPKVLFQ